MNVPDTVSDSRIRTMAEAYGGLVKIILRPDHQGAIVEYTDASNAGKAFLGLEDYEFTPGRHIRVGSVPEMLRERAEKKTDKIQVGKGRQDNTASAQTRLQPSGPIRRPGQQVGRRGGLGLRRGLGFKASNGESEKDSTGGSSGGRKSNDDFREMLTKKQ
jgi:squamous cell carcinoma antigen recognized by T-cells 3